MDNEKLSNMKKINEQEEEKVGGGYVVFRSGNIKPWEVIDDSNGKVLGRYDTEEEAKRMAKKKSQTDKEIKSWRELGALRKMGK